MDMDREALQVAKSLGSYHLRVSVRDFTSTMWLQSTTEPWVSGYWARMPQYCFDANLVISIWCKLPTYQTSIARDYRRLRKLMRLIPLFRFREPLHEFGRRQYFADDIFHPRRTIKVSTRKDHSANIEATLTDSKPVKLIRPLNTSCTRGRISFTVTVSH